MEGLTPVDGNSRGRHIARGISSLTVQSVLNATLGFILVASLLRFLSPDDYAAYSALAVSASLVGVTAGFGFNRSMVHYLAMDSTEGGEGWGAARAGYTVILGLSLAASAVLAVVAPFLSDYFMKSTAYAWVFYVGSLYLLMATLSAPAQALLQGMRKYTMLAKALLRSRLVAVAFGVTGVALYHSLAIAIMSLILYNALIVLAVLPAMWNYIRHASPRGQYANVARYAYPLGLAAIVTAVASNADIVVVGGYLQPSSLAIYYATVTISSVLSAFFLAPLVTALFAETSFSSGNEKQVRQGTGLALRFTLVSLFPASLMAVAMAPQLLDLFSGGGIYSEGTPFLQLIALFYFFFAVQTVALNVLQGVGRTKDVFVVGLVTSLVEVGLSMILVPEFGLLGAVTSRAAVMVAGCVVSLYFIRRYLQDSMDFAFLSKALLTAALPAVVIYGLTWLVSARAVTVVPYALLGGGIFVGVAKMVSLVSPEDKSFLTRVLPARLRWLRRIL